MGERHSHGAGIGALNGMYLFLFKLALTLVVPFIGFEAWQICEIISLREWRAAVSANRWTSKDQAAFAAIAMETHAIFDKRITLLESSKEKK